MGKKNFKMAAKNPRWPPKIQFLPIIFETVNIFDKDKEAIKFNRLFSI